MFLFKKSLKDEDILHGIRAGGTTRRLFENKFYEKYHYLIKQAAFKHKISEDDAQSAYSDAILTVIEHIIGRKQLQPCHSPQRAAHRGQPNAEYDSAKTAGGIYKDS